MTIELFLQINNVQLFLSIVILVMSVIYFNRRPIETKVLGLNYFLALLPFPVLLMLQLSGKDRNVPQNIHMIVSFITLSLLFYVALNRRFKSWFLGIGFVFLLYGVANMLFIQKNDINTYTKTASAIVLICYCLLYYYRLLVDLPVQHLQRVPMFWFVAGILIYNAGTLSLLLFTAYLVEVLHNDLLIYWTFHNILDIVQNLIVVIGLWQDLRNIRLPS